MASLTPIFLLDQRPSKVDLYQGCFYGNQLHPFCRSVMFSYPKSRFGFPNSLVFAIAAIAALWHLVQRYLEGMLGAGTR